MMGLIGFEKRTRVNINTYIFKCYFPDYAGAPVAQWVKRWLTDLAVPSSSPTQGEIFSTVNELHCTQPFIINLLLS